MVFGGGSCNGFKFGVASVVLAIAFGGTLRWVQLPASALGNVTVAAATALRFDSGSRTLDLIGGVLRCWVAFLCELGVARLWSVVRLCRVLSGSLRGRRLGISVGMGSVSCCS